MTRSAPNVEDGAHPLAAFAAIGATFAAFTQRAGRTLSLTIRSLAAALSSTYALSSAATLAVRMSGKCVIPVMLVVGPVGAMLALQSLTLTRAFGVDHLLSPLIAATVIRELAPGFSAVMVSFQAGAGIAAELGTMRVREELDALEVMGLDPLRLVVGPRILAAALTAPLLNALAIGTGILGAYIIAVGLSGMPHGLFADALPSGIKPNDLLVSELKCVVFGILLGGVSASFGYDAHGGPAGVGRAANRTVVATVILILASNYLLNTAIFGLRGGGTW